MNNFSEAPVAHKIGKITMKNIEVVERCAGPVVCACALCTHKHKSNRIKLT